MKGLSETERKWSNLKRLLTMFVILFWFIDRPSYNGCGCLFNIHLRVDERSTHPPTRVALRYVHQYTITSSASVTSEEDHQVLPSSDSSLSVLIVPAATPLLPLSSCIIYLHVALLAYGWTRGLKRIVWIYFCSFWGCPWSVTVAPKQDWPCGSNALTAHKQRRGLQMTTCHCPGSIICSSPGPLNRCLGCHRLWGLPYGEAYNKTSTINLSVSGRASPAAHAATFEQQQRQPAGCVGCMRGGGRGKSEEGWERRNERETLWH